MLIQFIEWEYNLINRQNESDFDANKVLFSAEVASSAIMMFHCLLFNNQNYKSVETGVVL